MLPSDEYYGAWAASGEIDILEAVNLGTQCDTCEGGKENKILGTLHFGGTWPKNHHKGNATVLPTTEDGFNVLVSSGKKVKCAGMWMASIMRP